MRILHLITRLDGGGSAVETLLTATAQQRAGREVILAHGPGVESAMTDAERTQLETWLAGFHDAGGRSHLVPHLLRAPGVHDVAAWREVSRLVEGGFDIVHTHTSKAGALGRMAAWKRARAVVHTPHGHVFHGYLGPLQTQLFLAIERMLARRCDALVAVSRAERDDSLRLGVGRPEQWRVIPSGVDVRAVAGAVDAWRAEHGDAREWDAVSVGRLVPVKGMDRLIRAWSRVCERRPDARLAIVGEGERRPELERLTRDLGLEDRVCFAGWRDPVPYLAAARCFALLSRNEGMGRAAVEALAAGLPCVAADVCGLAEVVTPDCGALVDADDAEATAMALLTWMERDVRAAARERARAFSLEAMNEALEALYAELLDG